MYYSRSVNSFYDNPASYQDVPADLVEISDELYAAVVSNRPLDKIIISDADGFPVLADIQAPVMSRDQVEAVRLAAYADPVTGSDRYFAEAARMQAMSETGWEDVRAAGVARYQAIQAEYPWS